MLQSLKAPQVCEPAAHVLKKMAKLDAAAVVAAGGVAAFVRVLKRGPENATQNAAAALCHIISSQDNVAQVVAGGPAA